MSQSILIVDDEQSILDMLKLQLEFEGYSVYTASSAKAVSYTHLTLPTILRV